MGIVSPKRLFASFRSHNLSFFSLASRNCPCLDTRLFHISHLSKHHFQADNFSSNRFIISVNTSTPHSIPLTQYPSHFNSQARLSTSLCQQLSSVHTSSLNLSSHIFTPLSYLIVSLSHRKVTWRWRSTSAEKGCCHERSSLRHSARLDEQPVLAAGKARIWHAPCRHVFGMTGPLTRQLLGGMSWIVVLEML